MQLLWEVGPLFLGFHKKNAIERAVPKLDPEGFQEAQMENLLGKMDGQKKGTRGREATDL